MTEFATPLAITMGDPSGIGPEIVAMSLARQTDGTTNIVIGCPKIMARAAAVASVDMSVMTVREISEAQFDGRTINVFESSDLSPLPAFGAVSSQGGKAAFDAIIKAIELARAGDVRGIVTAPINKEALAAAGVKYPGHTEMLADYGGVERVAMMLGNDDIRTVLVTIHCSLADAIKAADFDAQMAAIRLAHEGATSLGYANPRIAVAGLNPHAGEGGLFGREEIEIITPAIEAAKAEGLNVSGPWSGDTVFMQARQGKFDVVVAQYHDQGLIPVKYMGLEQGVNITLGLPFIRTSPDHGTAYDIAGKGAADPASLETAIRYANQLATTKQRESA